MSFQFDKTWKPLCLAIVLTAAMFEANRAEAAVAIKPEEIQQRNVWVKDRFLDAKPHCPPRLAISVTSCSSAIIVTSNLLEVDIPHFFAIAAMRIAEVLSRMIRGSTGRPSKSALRTSLPEMNTGFSSLWFSIRSTRPRD